jgi:D-glycero-D-manno-heptose 1,7-bisphosphate phosphatase
MGAAAVFLDRDGTIIEDTDYLDDPKDVRLLPGAAEAIRRFSEAGFLVVVASNQSGVARGLFDEKTLSSVHQRLETLLQAQGASLDGAYYCPYLDGPEAVVEAYRRDSELRKPKPGMLRQAAEELDIDLNRSWMIGDAAKDTQAGRHAGCRTIRLGHARDVNATHIVASLREAADLIAPRAGNASADRPATAAAPRPRDDEPVIRALERIHEELERAHRPMRQQDFSAARLFASLLQMFAIVMAVLGVIVLAGDDPAAATARFACACFLQLAALTAFAVDRFR